MFTDSPVARPGSHPVRRRVIQLRLSEAGLDAIDKLAAAEQRTRPDMIRLLLADGMAARAARRR